MKISRNELKDRYGIDLPVGKYIINVDGDSYTINTVKDDTDGCILVGENKAVGKVLNSRETFLRLYSILNENKDKNIYITIV